MTLTDRYNRAAPGWGARLAELGYDAAYRALFTDCGLPGDANAVCDIGTGSGAFARAFLGAHGPARRLTLIDPSARMLQTARTTLAPLARHIDTHPVRLDQIAAPTQRYDTVLAAHVIEHCPDPAAAIAQIHTLTKPGGAAVLVVSKPHICQWLIWLKWRHTWWAPSKIRALCLGAGFGNVRVRPFERGVPARTSVAYICHKPNEGP